MNYLFIKLLKMLNLLPTIPEPLLVVVPSLEEELSRKLEKKQNEPIL